MFQPSQSAADVAIDGNLALVAAVDQGQVIGDISNPVQPKQIGQGLFLRLW